MNQYEFHDLNVNTRGEPNWLPPEAMYIVRHGVGTPLEDLIQGYQTLTVTGRELAAYKLNTSEVEGVDGSMYLDATHPEREIEVTYQLVEKDDESFRAAYQLMNQYLSEKQFSFYFYDDDLYQWTGTVTEAETPAAGSNRVKSTFKITCSDPFKRLRNPVTYSGADTLTIAEPAYYPTVPDRMEVTLKAASKALTITNSRQTITLSGDFKAGDKVAFMFGNDATITLNGEPAINLLDLTSDFDNFAVKQDDKVTATPASALSLELRRKEL